MDLEQASFPGATPQQLQHPHVRELLAVHNAFRQELASMLEYVQDLLSGDRPALTAESDPRIQSLIQAGIQYSHKLHIHHQLETYTMFPSLQGLGLDTEIVDRLNAEHVEIAALVDEFSQSINALGQRHPSVLDSDLRRLAEALQAHLLYEETHVCPVLALLPK